MEESLGYLLLASKEGGNGRKLTTHMNEYFRLLAYT